VTQALVLHRDESRRVQRVASRPTRRGLGRQQTRNLAAELEDAGRVVAHPIRDRDTKFTRPFDDVWRFIGAQIIRTAVRAPNANAFRGALDRLGPS